MCLCYDAFVRTTLDLSDDAYHIAKTAAREQNKSLGRVVSEFITARREEPEEGSPDPTNEVFPTFRSVRRVTSEDVAALDDEE